MRLTLVRRLPSLATDIFRISPAVSKSLSSKNEAVVALESTVITHGMPYPQNWETAKKQEQIVSDNGAIPATIALMNGKISVGLNAEEIHQLAQADAKSSRKVSRRDLSYVVSQGGAAGGTNKKVFGGTTVSATMLLAHKAGISVFATGGIGGVHRDGQDSFDISADLTELGRTPVAVVCAGAKSILDIPRTLEYLETQGVCVATVGDTADFPSFFSRKSGFFSPCHVQNVQQAAELLYTQKRLGVQSGILFAVPIPEKDEIPCQQVEEWLQRALKEANSNGILGRDITPFLLKRLNELSLGETLKANVALLHNNAKVAAQIAVALKDLELGVESGEGSPSSVPTRSLRKESISASRQSSGSSSNRNAAAPVIIGGTVLDIMGKCQADLEMNGATYSGETFMSSGGVGRNIADCLTRLGSQPIFLSAIGQDASAQVIKKACGHMDLSNLLELPEFSTSCYIGLLARTGQLHAGVMNMDIHQQITPDYVSEHKAAIEKAPVVLLDGNLSLETLDYVLDLATQYKVPVWYEPTDIHKASKIFQSNSDSYKNVSYLSPNFKELRIILKHFGIASPKVITELFNRQQDDHSSSPTTDTVHPEVMKNMFVSLFSEHLPHLQLLLLKLGKWGSLAVKRHDKSSMRSDAPTHSLTDTGLSLLSWTYCAAPSVPDDAVISVSGTGDCMVGGIIHGLINGWEGERAIELGTLAAACSLKARATVPVTIESLCIPMSKKASCSS